MNLKSRLSSQNTEHSEKMWQEPVMLRVKEGRAELGDCCKGNFSLECQSLLQTGYNVLGAHLPTGVAFGVGEHLFSVYAVQLYDLMPPSKGLMTCRPMTRGLGPSR